MNRWTNNYYGQHSRQNSAVRTEAPTRAVQFREGSQDQVSRPSGTGPGNVARLWIFRVVHLTDVTLVSFIKRQGVQVLDVEQVSPENATYKSFKVTVDEEDAPTLLYRTSWPGLVGCRLWKDQETHAEDDPLAETSTKATFSKSLHTTTLRALLGLSSLYASKKSFDDSQIDLRRSFQAHDGTRGFGGEKRLDKTAFKDFANRRDETRLRRAFSEDQIPEVNQKTFIQDREKRTSYGRKNKTSHGKTANPDQSGTQKPATQSRGRTSHQRLTSRSARGRENGQKSATYPASRLPNKKSSRHGNSRRKNVRSRKHTNGTGPNNDNTRRSRTGGTKSVIANGRNRRDNNVNGQAFNQSTVISNSIPRKKTGKELRTKVERDVNEDKHGTDAREKQKPSATSSTNGLKKVTGSNRSQESIHSNTDASVDEANRKSGIKQVPEKSREKVNTANTTKNENDEVSNKEKQRSIGQTNMGNTPSQENNDKASDKDESIPNQRETDTRRSTSYEDISSKDDLSKTARNLKRSFNSLHNVHINTYDKNRGTYDISNEFSNLPNSQISKDGTTRNLQPESSTNGPSQQLNWVVLLSGLLILSPDEAVDHLLGSEFDGLLAREIVSDDELFIGMKVLAHASRSDADPNKLEMLAYKIWQPHIIELIRTFSVTVEKYYPERAERYFWDLAEFLDIYVSYKLQIDKLPNLVSACLSEVLVLSYKSYVSEELVNIYRKMQDSRMRTEAPV
ncbi:uncharacterized protein LOC125036422 [Penaeus chinensis]|uniref:uncharacterized protein LOC125036422 n=1 Tax=Penaeus chinensis TaxID=139456 RepID=UPI001FB84A1F|nr:uncharacterized protein LOC125036422 [Penaeus chinensis]